MTRPLRLEYPFAVYHITSRGNARQDIFLDNTDRLSLLGVIASVVLRYNWLCHAYCLMGNHYHLVIETPDANLSLGMRQLNGTYTQSFNKRHGRVGHIFQGRFKAVVVQKDSHLLELSRYVVLNPIRAGIVTAPEHWRWSSYRGTQGLSAADSFLTCSWILSQFGGTTGDARKRYRSFVIEGMAKPDPPWGKLKGELIFGDNEFTANMQELIGGKESISEIPNRQRHVGRPSLNSIFTEMATRSKGARNAAIVEAHLRHGYELKEIADHLEIHYTSVSKIIRNSLEKK